MASLASSLFDIFSGNPTEKQQNDINNLYGYETGKGENALNQGLGFYSDILSGDPSKIAQVLAPEIRAGQNMVQQTAGQNAMFGNRGGGTNASTQGAQANERGNIISLIGNLQGGSAGALTGAGENLVNQGAGNMMNSANLATANRQRLTGDVGGIVKGAAEIAAPFLGGAGAAMPTGDIVSANNPMIKNYLQTHGPDPSMSDWSGMDQSHPDLSVFNF